MIEERTTAGRIVGGRYVLEQELARGGAATVWRAKDAREDRIVAVKLLHREVRDRGKLRERFATEAKVLLAIEHPRIACAYAFDIDGELPYMAMELVPGEPLDAELGRRAGARKYYEGREVIDLLAQIADGLDYAHDLGVVHRDLKPSNLIVSNGSLKIVDFGVAKLLGREPGEDTTQGRLLGTVMYMSPEQARGKTVDPRADVFSLGVIAFEMLTLKRAWARDDDGRPLNAYAEPVRLNAYNAPAKTLDAIAVAPRPRASECVPVLPAEVDRVLARAMAIAPEDRFAGASEFVDALEQALGVEKTVARRPRRESAPQKARENSRAHSARDLRRTTAVGVVALAFAAVAAAVTLTPAPVDTPRAPPVDTATVAAAAPRAIANEPPPAPEPEPAPIPAPASIAVRPAPKKAPPVAPAPVLKTEPAERLALAKHREDLRKLADAPNATELTALGERIAQTASLLGDQKARARIARLARSSAGLGDHEGVSRAIDAIDAALAASGQ